MWKTRLFRGSNHTKDMSHSGIIPSGIEKETFEPTKNKLYTSKIQPLFEALRWPSACPHPVQPWPFAWFHRRVDHTTAARADNACAKGTPR